MVLELCKDWITIDGMPESGHSSFGNYGLRVVQKTSFWQRHKEVSMNERQVKMINLLWDGFEGKLTTSKWAKITKTSSATALRDITDLLTKGS